MLDRTSCDVVAAAAQGDAGERGQVGVGIKLGRLWRFSEHDRVLWVLEARSGAAAAEEGIVAAAPEQGFDSFILRGRDAYELGRLVAARTLALGSCVPREGIVTHAVTIVCSGLKGHQTVRERRGLRSRQVEQAQRATSCRARGKGEASIDLQQSKRGAVSLKIDLCKRARWRATTWTGTRKRVKTRRQGP